MKDKKLKQLGLYYLKRKNRVLVKNGFRNLYVNIQNYTLVCLQYVEFWNHEQIVKLKIWSENIQMLIFNVKKNNALFNLLSILTGKYQNGN